MEAIKFTKIASLDQLEEGRSKSFPFNGEQLILLCKKDGTVFALADVCSHDGAALGEGELEDCQVECPRHGARFDITTGQPLCLPAISPLTIYQVEIRGQDVYIGSPASSNR
jgi:3-phenylpropionate/trans-cinnamate dioxygenase ferredoxin subunit